MQYVYDPVLHDNEAYAIHKQQPRMGKIMTRPHKLCLLHHPKPESSRPEVWCSAFHTTVCISSLQTGTNNDKCHARFSRNSFGKKHQDGGSLASPSEPKQGENWRRYHWQHILVERFNTCNYVLQQGNKHPPCPDECWLPGKSSLLSILRVL